MDKGLLIVLSGPSGTGKGTVCKALLNKRRDLLLSISSTTREPRTGEIHGKHYFFTNRDEFEKCIKHNQFLEHANVFSNYYGTPRSFVDGMIAQGKDVLLEIDVQGALKVKDTCPDGVFIFLIPPTMAELERRIRSRGTETEDKIRERLGKANAEMNLMEKYDYVIVNDDVKSVVVRIDCIIESEKMRVRRNLEKYNSLRSETI